MQLAEGFGELPRLVFVKAYAFHFVATSELGYDFLLALIPDLNLAGEAPKTTQRVPCRRHPNVGHLAFA